MCIIIQSCTAIAPWVSASASTTTSTDSPIQRGDDDVDFDGYESAAEKCQDDHTHRKLKAVEAWNKIRPSLVSSFTRMSGFPSSPTLCMFCKSCDACVWCQVCGAASFLCEDCATKIHSSLNLFHNPFLWKVCQSLCFPTPFVTVNVFNAGR